jgi:biofilm PGA synthesis N-glycosyltransferase PgaC
VLGRQIPGHGSIVADANCSRTSARNSLGASREWPSIGNSMTLAAAVAILEAAEHGADVDADDGTRAQHVFAEPPPPIQAPSGSAAKGRLVVALVVAAIIGIAGVVAAVALYVDNRSVPGERYQVTLGPFEFDVSTTVPSREIFAAALLAIVVIAAVAVVMETIAALLSVNPRRQLLSWYRPYVPAGRAEHYTITVLVPAHNEEALLPITLAALQEQTRPPDRVVVVADNCTDRTVEIAEEMGHEVFETSGNRDRKAGALNQALKRILPTLGPADLVMVMDADTSLGERFLEAAEAEFRDDDELSAVGGLFYGDRGSRILGQFQRNEYARYSTQIKARHGRVFVLTGTASVFRSEVLKDVAAGRGVFVPGTPGDVYDTIALTEDNELTLALKSLGATMTSPSECRVVTEIMPTWRALWVQRKRWQRGALENLAEYGFTLGTARYWLQQVGLGYGVVAFFLYLSTFAITLLAGVDITWVLFWVFIGFLFVCERVITAWSAGWGGRFLAALLFPELAYAVFLHVIFAKSLFDIAAGKRTSWGHVAHPAAEGASSG